MPRFLLLLIFFVASSAYAAQSISPAVFNALERARSAQEKGDYATANKTLEQATAKDGSIEQALLWRSRGYLAWAEGNTRKALEWLEKAVESGKLDDELLANERRNLARLNLA